MDAIRVLYVEDDRSDRELTRRHLQAHAPHLVLTEADTVAGALERLTAGHVDLVLSDLRLPDGTGLELLETIRGRGINVPVVLVTGSGDSDSAVRLLKAGAADYVVKRPGYLQTLPPVLEGAFRWFQSASEVRQTVIRVLYAEHDPGDVDLTRRAFREYGLRMHLDVVRQGREVLQRLSTSPYDLVLLDHRMPDMTGIDMLKILRGERIRVPVVMVTGEGDEETAVEAFKLGAADYIIKREGYLTKLPSTLENVLAHRRLADEKDALLLLNRLARSLTAVQDVGELVQLVVRAATELLRAEIAILWLADGLELHAAGWAGVPESALRSLDLRVEALFAEAAIADRHVEFPDLARGMGAASGLWLERVRGALAISLVAGGRLAGVLALATEQPREFGGMEERLLTILADHAAIALENARLYRQLKDGLEELQHTQARLLQTEKIAAMGQLLSGVAHELNNPLAVVVGQAQLIREKAAGSSALERSADKLTQAAGRCARIVRNFLALARQYPPERTQAHLNQIVTEALELVAYPLRVDGVQVTLNLSEDLPVLWADPHQLHQVLVNLMTNAHHAMRENSRPRQLTVTSRYDAVHRRVVVEVADTGPGIPPQIVKRIFEPFFTTKPPGQGTGLGLSLCQGLIDGHGGSISAESQAGEGTVFIVELPVEAPPVASQEVRASETTPPIKGKAILVVDDEADVADVLSDMLSADGYRVETASSGTVALDKLRSHTYDLILSDLRMPDLDGPGLYHELQQREPSLCRRVIFLTGDVLSPPMTAFLAKTAAPSLTKPFTLDEVRRAVRSVLRTN